MRARLQCPWSSGGRSNVFRERGLPDQRRSFACGRATLAQRSGLLCGIGLPTVASVGPRLSIAAAPERGLQGIYGSVIGAGLFAVLAASFMSRLSPLFPLVTGIIIPMIGTSLMRTGVANVAVLLGIVAGRRPGLVGRRDAIRPGSVRHTGRYRDAVALRYPAMSFGADPHHVDRNGSGNHRVGRDVSGACRYANRKINQTALARRLPAAKSGSSRLAAIQPYVATPSATASPPPVALHLAKPAKPALAWSPLRSCPVAEIFGPAHT
jgi:Permease family